MDKERKFTTKEVSAILGCSQHLVLTAGNKLGIGNERLYLNHSLNRMWTEQDIEKIKELVRQRKEANAGWYRRININKEQKQKEKEMQLEQLRKEHPLVKDDRCFILSWFPNVVPNIEEFEDE